ncbi:hypothetical protein ALQ05_200023 [Pseudomonas amygdali pv. mori]|uniref:Uncharacterized protein n=1 Tax=Pseudomonas amygdali pv. mori TaxID=34065 RepID=A0A3M4L5S1_PSEA0|nr:hypothetical protein ALQ05_200023 [Pseudomonas amygdali pv. mori]
MASPQVKLLNEEAPFNILAIRNHQVHSITSLLECLSIGIRNWAKNLAGIASGYNIGR